MKKHRALEDTIDRARHYAKMARDSLELFPASAWKHALLDAVVFVGYPWVAHAFPQLFA